MKEKIIKFLIGVRKWMANAAVVYEQLQSEGDWDTQRREDLDRDVRRLRWVTSMLYNSRYLIGDINDPQLNTLDFTDTEIDQIISDWSYYLGFDSMGSLYGIAFVVPYVNLIEVNNPGLTGDFVLNGGRDNWLITQLNGEPIWVPRPTIFDGGQL